MVIREMILEFLDNLSFKSCEGQDAADRMLRGLEFKGLLGAGDTDQKISTEGFSKCLSSIYLQ
jgi:hypothetical protein